MWDVATCVAAARFLAALACMADPMRAILNKPLVHGFIYAACLATVTCQACTSAELQAVMLYQAQKTSSAPMLPVDTSLWSMTQLVSSHYAVSTVRNLVIFFMC